MPKVKLFGIVSCSHCKVLKDILESNNIKFEYFDVILDKKAQKEMIERSGQENIPVIEIDENIIVDFDIKKIRELLNI